MNAKQRSFRVEAIMLRYNEYGEADRILTLYTRQRGKIRAIAKGVRKVRSRKAGHLEPFTRVELQLAVGREMYIVTQAEAKDTFPILRQDLLKMSYATYSAELVDKFTYDEEENSAIFRLLVRTLSRLSKDYDPETVIRYFEIHLLDFLGFRPELQTCVNCGQDVVEQDQFFSSAHGGVLCPKCGQGREGARPVSQQALKYMRHFQRSRFRDALRARPAPSIQREQEILQQHYITYLLERAINSSSFLRRIRREGQEESLTTEKE
jgi:DNA repair protein RecO (recombination protein O)